MAIDLQRNGIVFLAAGIVQELWCKFVFPPFIF
jgi:hypothetical protein